METKTRKHITLLLLTEEKEALLAKARTVRAELVAFQQAIAHVELAILSVNTSPLNESAAAALPKSLQSEADSPHLVAFTKQLASGIAAARPINGKSKQLTPARPLPA